MFVRALAEAAQIPPSYLAKIVNVLARKGYLATQRGLNGGVSLARPAEDINLLRQDQEALLNSAPLMPDSTQAAAIGNYVLIDASAEGEGEELLNRLRTHFPREEMKSPDGAVHVHRFRF